MAIAMRGLKVKPPYEQLIGVAPSDGLEQIKFPNRDASFLRNGFILSQLDGEGMRAMEEQQQRHIKEVYMGSVLKSLASDPGDERISNFSFKSAYTQNTQTQGINEMITKPVKAKKNNDNAEFFELSSGGDMDQLDLEEVASSEGQVDMINYIHISDYQGSIMNIENGFRLKEVENERRMQEQ